MPVDPAERPLHRQFRRELECRIGHKPRLVAGSLGGSERVERIFEVMPAQALQRMVDEDEF